jgi:hypothetical protein
MNARKKKLLFAEAFSSEPKKLHFSESSGSRAHVASARVSNAMCGIWKSSIFLQFAQQALLILDTKKRERESVLFSLER